MERDGVNENVDGGKEVGKY